jgi:hypothetical protein
VDSHALVPVVPNPRPGPEPADDGLVEQSRARVRKALGSERVATAASVLAFVAAAVGLLWLPTNGRSPSTAVLVGLVLCYAVAARVHFEVGIGLAVPTQLVFVPMLFMAPLRLVPLLVALGFIASSVPEYVRGAWHPGRIGLRIVSAWYAIGPVLVLAAVGSPSPSVARLPILLAAVAAQLLFDFACAAVRARPLGISTRALLRMLGPASLVDLALTPVALALAVAGSAVRGQVPGESSVPAVAVSTLFACLALVWALAVVDVGKLALERQR